ncbi:hypothetical protein BC332_06631 [Capsicum chinense]|nr:hypothetical protein BC332_06631 [Capsicum chinense]
MAEIYGVSFYGDQIEVIVTKNAAVVNHWINSHRRRLHTLLVGLDIEWLPCFNPEENHPVALLQLCVGRRCLLFQLLHKDAVPRFLVDFLMDPNFKFVGVGVKGDAEKLLRDHKLLVANTVDLNQLALSVYGEEVYGKMGLKRMAKEVLGKVMEKPLNVTLNLRGSPSLQAEVKTKKLDAERMSDKGDTLTMEGTTSQTVDSNEMENMRVTLEAMTRALERLSTEVGAIRGEVTTINGRLEQVESQRNSRPSTPRHVSSSGHDRNSSGTVTLETWP